MGHFVPGPFQFDMLTCLLPRTEMTSGIPPQKMPSYWIWMIPFLFSKQLEKVLTFCNIILYDGAHIRSGKHRLNYLRKAQSHPPSDPCIDTSSCQDKRCAERYTDPRNLQTNKGLTSFSTQRPRQEEACACLPLNGEALSFPRRHLSFATTLRASFKQKNLAIMWH